MAKTKITENRDQKVKEERLEIRLSKAQKDAIKSNAQKQHGRDAASTLDSNTDNLSCFRERYAPWHLGDFALNKILLRTI